ncbi:MAG: U32 family peptidase [Defluviitaleaceae bacterium]|nr:U32 family peptidase [Defluviitaleaceae bacterium]
MRERGIKVPELLSPAADMLCVTAAVENGCDAVYVGGKSYSARSGAANFTHDEFRRAADYCHLRGVKIYVAVNTLYKDSELDGLYGFVREVYAAGADALITADIGVSTQIRKLFPDIELHASTQMGADSYNGAAFLQGLGFSRVVIARETPLAQVKRIADGLEIGAEVFAHGAMCYAYSGRCLMSGLIGGRSGNRGRCAQPCRLKYSLERGGVKAADGHLLSMRDLCTLPMIADIARSGAVSLKIEGRQKSAQYVAAATRAYRNALDAAAEGRENIHGDEDALSVSRVFCRGGTYSAGYLRPGEGGNLIDTDTPKHRGSVVGLIAGYQRGRYSFVATEDLVPGDGIEVAGADGGSAGAAVNAAVKPGQSFEFAADARIAPDAPVYKSFDKRENERLTATFNRPRRKLTVYADVTAKIGQELTMSLYLGGLRAQGRGGLVQAADNAPVSRETMLGKLSKAGDTPFCIRFKHVDIDDGLFVPVSELNTLRRRLCESFAQSLTETARRETPDVRAAFTGTEGKLPATARAGLCVCTYDTAQLDAVLEVDGIARYICEARPEFVKHADVYAGRAHAAGALLFAALPPAAPDKAVEDIVAALEASGVDGYLLTNLAHFTATAHSAKLRAAGSELHAANGLTLRELRGHVSTVTLSQELTLDEIASLADNTCEVVVHGHHAAYITKTCPARHDGCSGQNTEPRSYTLEDRKGMRLPVLCRCEHCYAVILHGQCLSMLDRLGDLQRTGAGLHRLNFTVEPPEIAAAVAAAYAQGRESLCAQSSRYYNGATTRGYFYRGIE